MDPHRLSRIAAIIVGAGVLFGLRQMWDLSHYIAIPAAIVAYVATLVGLTVLQKRRTQT